MPRPDTAGGETAARLATLPDRLPLDEPRLIGIVGAPGARRALIREANGSVHTVSTGDTAFGGQIRMIVEDRIRVERPDSTFDVTLVDYGPAFPSPRPRLRPRSIPTG